MSVLHEGTDKQNREWDLLVDEHHDEDRVWPGFWDDPK